MDLPGDLSQTDYHAAICIRGAGVTVDRLSWESSERHHSCRSGPAKRLEVAREVAVPDDHRAVVTDAGGHGLRGAGQGAQAHEPVGLRPDGHLPIRLTTGIRVSDDYFSVGARAARKTERAVGEQPESNRSP